MQTFLDTVTNSFQSAYDYVTGRIPVQYLIYFGIALVALLVIWILSRMLKRRKIAARLSDEEVEVNEIRNNSLQYKFNKATAFAKSSPEIEERIQQLAPKYEICMKSIESCENLYDSAQDYLDRHRYNKTNKTLDELETMLEDTRERMRIVTQSLDHILQKEVEVRERSNQLKERFRQIRNIYQTNRQAFFSGAIYMDGQVQEIEDAFSVFEEQMYASEFLKAKEEIDAIALQLDQLTNMIAVFPELYTKARQLLPTALKEVAMQIREIEESGIDISYMNADGKMEAINNALSDTLVKLDNGNLKAAKEALDTISDQILALQDDISQERKAFDEIHGNMEANFAIVDAVDSELAGVVELYTNIKDRFGLEDWSKRFEKAALELEEIKEERKKIITMLQNDETLQADVIHVYREFAKKANDFSKQVHEMKRMLVTASSDESRARKQIIKLQLILNEVRLNTLSKQLPSISVQFDEDVQTGEEKIVKVKEVLQTTPLDTEQLNAALQEAIDFIYKLYNNANNLVGVALMVENAIVFGNRFRSSYPALNSDLTRAELCFQNGEYTRALRIAVQALDVVHPGIYEKLIEQKDPAITNLGGL